MEIAVEEERSEVRGGMARLIESCICPIGYTGLSCQVMVPVSPRHLMKPHRLYWYLSSKHQCFSVENNLIDQQNWLINKAWLIISSGSFDHFTVWTCLSLSHLWSVSLWPPICLFLECLPLPPVSLSHCLCDLPPSLTCLSLTCLSAGVCCRFFPSAIVWVVVSQSEVAVSSSVCSMPLQQPQWELRSRDWRLSGNMLAYANTC